MKLLSILLKRFSLLSKLCTQQNVLVFLCSSHIYKSCTEIASSTHEYQFKSFLGLIFFKNHIFFSIQEQSPSGTKNTIECGGLCWCHEIVIGQQGVDVLPLLSWILTSAWHSSNICIISRFPIKEAWCKADILIQQKYFIFYFIINHSCISICINILYMRVTDV